MTDSSTWSRGYPVHEPYPPAWHGIQSPAHLRLACAMLGVAWDVDAQTPLQIAEVGCGTGYTAQLLAAGNPHWQVTGLDYNPAHIAEARSCAAEAGLDNVHFLEADIAEMDVAAMDSLPEFDLITVHGMWSWVADPVREGLLRLIRRRLKPGGLAMISYNALPGAAHSLGFARLVQRSLHIAGGPADGLGHAGQAVKRLLATDPAHLKSSTWTRMVTGELAGARPGYLLHEFSTEHWRPCFHADVAQAMSSARCEFAGSATLDENFPQMSLSPEQQQLWDEAPDPVSRELIFDLCVPRLFRRDIFVRGLRRMARDPAVEALWLGLGNAMPGERVLSTQLGEARLPQAITDAALEALARGPQTVGALRAIDGCGGATPSELATLLVGAGCAVPLWCVPGQAMDTGADPALALQRSRALNAVVARRLAHGGRALGQFGLASPYLGGALPASALELAIAPCLVGHPTGSRDANDVIGQILPSGEVLPAEVMDDLQATVRRVLDGRWPIWQSFGIV
jgi:SAM-dependent methyltransferase